MARLQGGPDTAVGLLREESWLVQLATMLRKAGFKKANNCSNNLLPDDSD